MKKVIYLLICLLLPFQVFGAETSGPIEEPDVLVVADIKENGELVENATSAILIDASTESIIYEKNPHEKLAPASMTKMMSMLLIIEAIENKVINWNDIITVSSNASGMGGSQILLETGEKMSVKDLFKGVAVASGNDAVVALAEATYGSVDAFVDAMNKKAKELKLQDTNFKNVHGLDDENHYSSAYDMSLIAKELVKHKKILEFTSIYEDYLRRGTDREFWLVNTNRLVRFYSGVDGLKTGYTPEAGFCLTATIKKDNMRLIAVVMGEPSSDVRNNEVTELLNYGFAQYKSINIVEKNQMITEIKMPKSKNINVEIVPKEDVNVLIKKTDKIGKISYNVKLNVVLEVETTDLIISSVKNDIGTGYVVKKSVKKELENKELIELKTKYNLPKLELNLVYIEDYLTNLSRNFIKNHIKK